MATPTSPELAVSISCPIMSYDFFRGATGFDDQQLGVLTNDDTGIKGRMVRLRLTVKDFTWTYA